MKQNKIKYNLGKQTAGISALSLRNVDRSEFLTGEAVLLEKGLLEKAATIKQFEYSPLNSELKKQTSIAKYQYEGLDRVCKCN